MAKKRDKEIHPPEFPDPLKPGGVPDEALPTTDELREAVATGEAEPGPPLPPEEAEQLTEADVVDLTEEVPGPSPYGPAPGPPVTIEDEIVKRSATLKQIVLGALDPGTDLPIAGAPVLFCYRPGKWRAAVATRLSGIAADGNVLIDLLINEGEAQAEPKSVRYGDGVANWKFPIEPC